MDSKLHHHIFYTREALTDEDMNILKSMFDDPLIDKIRAGRGPHLLTASTGEQEYCGGPGVCKWCDKGRG